MKSEITRREFLGASAAGIALASAGMLAPQRVLGANDRLRVGVIGAGDRMGSLMNEFHGQSEAMNCQLTGLCDIWKVNRDKAAGKITKWYGAAPKIYKTYEEMLADKNIDAVMIGTCDGMHASMLRKAILAGKHTYCEKPTANTLEDANALIAASEAHTDVIVQIGTQRRSEGEWYAAGEFLKTGALGTISRVNVAWNYYGARWIRDCKNVRAEDVDWKQFQFGMMNKPFDAKLFHEWRLFRPYSTGIPCQWMSHMIDAAHMVTGATYPKSCVALGGTYVWKDERQNGDTFEALFEYPEGFILNYTTGFGNDKPGNEMSIYGTKGTLDCSNWKASGSGGGKDIRMKDEVKLTGEKLSGHMQNWLESVRAGKQPRATVQHGYQHSIALVLAVRALDTGRKQVFDPERRTITSV